MRESKAKILHQVAVLSCVFLATTDPAWTAPQVDVDEAVRVLSAPAAPSSPTEKAGCDRNSFIPGTLDHPKCQNLGFNLGAVSVGAERMPSARRARSEMRVASVRAEAPNVDLKLTFDLNSAVLTPQDIENTEAIAKAMRNPALAGLRFRVEGYTDRSGPLSTNLALSQQRADSAKTYLISVGIEPARLEAKGFGPVLVHPDAPNDRANRRVVVRRIDD